MLDRRGAASDAGDDRADQPNRPFTGRPRRCHQHHHDRSEAGAARRDGGRAAHGRRTTPTGIAILRDWELLQTLNRIRPRSETAVSVGKVPTLDELETVGRLTS